MKKNHPAQSYSRRQFLRMGGSCAAMSQLPLMSTMVMLGATRAALAQSPAAGGYKALVCIALSGGNDSFNMLSPIDYEARGEYEDARTNLAESMEGLHQLVDARDGRRYGLHASMPDVAQLYRDGALSFVNNVGTLIRPTTMKQIQRGEARLPLGLFSHSDQQRHWQTAVPQSRTERTGWAGRMADYLSDQVNFDAPIGMNIAVGQLNILQTGVGQLPYVVDGRGGASVLEGYGGSHVQDRIVTEATDAMLEDIYDDLLKLTHARSRRRAIDAARAYQAATSGVILKTEFPKTALGERLRQVAVAIAARTELVHHRQMFVVDQGGYDTHDAQHKQHPRLLRELNDALKAFHAALVELGCLDQVMTYTASDFGRTLSSNGDGSDHGWGGNQIVMGGALARCSNPRMYGEYPQSLAMGNALDVGRGRLLPTTAVDQYMAELALWLGVPNDHTLVDILPNIRNFYGPGNLNGPLGMLPMQGRADNCLLNSTLGRGLSGL